MTTDERQVLRERITKQIARTQEKIAQMEEMTQPVAPENSIGRISRMDAINNKSVMEAALREARRELTQLEHADRHLDDADFGVCAQCGDDIPFKRLMLLPGSTKCMRCAQ